MIDFADIGFTANRQVILHDITFTIPEGEFVAIIGPNGAGKSTLLKLLLNLLPPTTGTIRIDNIDHTVWHRDNLIGYLPQKEEFSRDFPATALDIVLLGSPNRGKWFSQVNRQQRKSALAMMNRLGIESFANAAIGDLSGGEFQRVRLARAMLTGSKYLILDEPEASVDQPGVESFFKLLEELHREGRTIITVSHDLHTLNRYCTFLVCLNKSLHCHDAIELVNAEAVKTAFGDMVQLVDKHY